MRYLICSDIHGNLPAFEKMLEVEKDFDSFICLGDLVNYGPWSNECVDLAMSLSNSQIIMGNHEQYFISGSYPGGNLVTAFFNQTYPQFNRSSEISTFVHSIKLDYFLLAHTIGQDSIYPDTKIDLKSNYVIGHSHHQFEYKNNGFTLYNVGSVGQNRKYINVINYAMYDKDTGNIELKFLKYDVNHLIRKMIDLNYPKECINYYKQKPLL